MLHSPRCINGLRLHFHSHQLLSLMTERNIPSFYSSCIDDMHSVQKGVGESTTFPNPVIQLEKNPKGLSLLLDH